MFEHVPPNVQNTSANSEPGVSLGPAEVDHSEARRLERPLGRRIRQRPGLDDDISPMRRVLNESSPM